MGLEGAVKDLPYEVRKLIHDEAIKIDLEEHDAFVKEEKDKGEDVTGASYETDVPGLMFMVGPDDIVAFITTLIQDTGEKKVLSLRLPRNEIAKLIEEE